MVQMKNEGESSISLVELQQDSPNIDDVAVFLVLLVLHATQKLLHQNEGTPSPQTQKKRLILMDQGMGCSST